MVGTTAVSQDDMMLDAGLITAAQFAQGLKKCGCVLVYGTRVAEDVC